MWRRAPDGLRTDDFVLEPLGSQHNESDFVAWSSSIDHIRATPGFRADQWGGDEWPYPMSPEENLADLQQHADEFARGEAFAYTVLDPATGEVIGCVYVDPDDIVDARCRMWLRTDRAHLDSALERTVRDWLALPEWDFSAVRLPGRD